MIESRGVIDIRGIGKVNTHFLEGNRKVTDKELCGEPTTCGVNEHLDVAFIDEGKVMHPPMTSACSSGSWTPTLGRNRVGPTQKGKVRSI